MKRIIIMLMILSGFFVVSCSKVKTIEISLQSEALPDSVWSIGSIAEGNGRRYLFDFDRQSIWIMKTNGTLIKEKKLIKGKGPGEVLRPTSLSLSNNKLFLLDSQLSRVSYFDTSGSFIGSLQIPFFVTQIRMAVKQDTVIILCGDAKSQKLVHYFDLNGNKIKDIISINELNYPENILGLKNNKIKGIGQFFTPSDWSVQGDTIWLSNMYSYQIAKFVNGEKVFEILGNNNLLNPPELSSSESNGNQTCSIQINGQTSINFYDNYIIYNIISRITPITSKEIKYKHIMQIISKKNGKLLAQKSYVNTIGKGSTPPALHSVVNSKIYFSTYSKLFKGEIKLK